MSDNISVNDFSRTDLLLMKTVYRMRCLTVSQAWRCSYKKVMSFEDFFRQKLLPMYSRYHVITIENFNNSEYVIFLTDLGVDILRRGMGLPPVIVNQATGHHTRPLLSAGEIKLHPRLIEHQSALNDFVLAFRDNYKLSKYPEKLQYFDEKYVSQYTFIRPDGMIRLGVLDLFLEQDMATENRKQLEEKWNKYRRFLTANRSEYEHRKIIVLFIVKCDVEQLEARKELIRHTASTVFVEMLSDNFDVYVGTKQEILMACFQKILPIHFGNYDAAPNLLDPLKRQGFTISSGKKLNVVVGGSMCGYYIRRLTKDGKIVQIDGTAQEFMCDEYFHSPMSVLSKADYARRTSSDFRIKFRRDINYLIVTDNAYQTWRDLKSACTFPLRNVLLTTPARLRTLPINEAIFTLDAAGSVNHFVSEAFQYTNYEGDVTKLYIDGKI
jgi:hypothetical protein